MKHCPFCKSYDIQKLGPEGPGHIRLCQCQNCFAEAYEDFWDQRPDMDLLESLQEQNHLLKVTNNELRKYTRMNLRGLSDEMYNQIVEAMVKVELRQMAKELKEKKDKEKKERARLKRIAAKKLENQEDQPEDLLPEEARNDQ